MSDGRPLRAGRRLPRDGRGRGSGRRPRGERLSRSVRRPAGSLSGPNSGLVAREEHPDVEIIVAANDPGISSKLYSAGADYVLSLPKVAGRMATRELFDEDVMTLREQIRVVRTEAPALDGAHPADGDIRRETDSVIVGVKRNGDVVIDFDEGFRIGADDEIVVAGTDRGVSQFEREYAE